MTTCSCLFLYTIKIKLKVKKRHILVALLIALAAYMAISWRAVSYGYVQAKGQLKVIRNTQPVAEILASENTPDSVKAKIKLIADIKKFAVDSLGLSPSGSYSSFYDQGGKPIIWMITAAPPYKLEAKTWEFPILGTFRYKGYFEEELVKKEIASLKSDGYETRISEVSAWSTLGILNDPILSSMLTYSEPELASLIIHELTHGTLFVKNDLSFNENLASFIGNKGSLAFLKAKYGAKAEIFKEIELQKEKQKLFVTKMIAGANSLDSLYQTFGSNFTSNEKETKKWQLIESIVEDSYGRELSSAELKRFNNAYFVGFLTYREKQDTFEEQFQKEFDGDIKTFLSYWKSQYGPLFPWQ